MSYLGDRDLTIEWDEAGHEVLVSQIQRLLDQGIGFYRISQDRRGRTRLLKLHGVGEIEQRRHVLKAADLDRIVAENLHRFLGNLPK